jgi:hypothetical protein
MATIYFLATACNINGINPYEYFFYGLPDVSSNPVNAIANLLPLS